MAVLVDVRIGRHEGFDRIVFEFQGGLPGYRLQYTDPPILAGPSGLPVKIEGAAFLMASFNVAAGYDPNSGGPTYTGPLDILSRLPSIIEAERTEDFEGYLTWVLGLTRKVEFRVAEFHNPFRIALDVAHP